VILSDTTSDASLGLNLNNSYRVVFKPNCSLTSRGKVKVIVLLTVIPCCIAIGFSLLGAWLVLPFVGLEIFALAYAFYYVSRQDSDYESISIDSNSLVIERYSQQRHTKHVLNPYWVKLIRYELPNGEMHLGLLTQGKVFEVGRYLTRKQRELLAKQLEKRTGTFFKG
jgi:uncharacterized membrane protein